MCLQFWHLFFQAILNWEYSLLLVKMYVCLSGGETCLDFIVGCGHLIHIKVYVRLLNLHDVNCPGVSA